MPPAQTTPPTDVLCVFLRTGTTFAVIAGVQCVLKQGKHFPRDDQIITQLIIVINLIIRKQQHNDVGAVELLKS